jgi:hypothetical protein
MTSERTIFQGEFGEILIPDLLTFLDMLGKTGSLEVTRRDVTKRIFWHDGEIVFADSTQGDEQIGEYLVRNGWVTRAALATARDTGGSADALIMTLIRNGELQAQILPRTVKSLVLDIVYSIFEWKEGTFRFVLTDDAHAERVVLKTSVSNIIMEGSRRLDEWNRIRATFASDEVRLAPASVGDSTLAQLSPVEIDVLDAVDGQRTIADIVSVVEHDQFSVLNALLTLYGLGLIRKVATLGTQEAKAAAPPIAMGDALPASGNGLSPHEKTVAIEIVSAFNNIFADLHERIERLKGTAGLSRFAEALEQDTFQRSAILAGVKFTQEGRLPEETIVRNLSPLPAGDRIPKLRGSLDRLLARQVLQLDTTYPAAEKQAFSELIAREKSRIRRDAGAA